MPPKAGTANPVSLFAGMHWPEAHFPPPNGFDPVHNSKTDYYDTSMGTPMGSKEYCLNASMLAVS